MQAKSPGWQWCSGLSCPLPRGHSEAWALLKCPFNLQGMAGRNSLFLCRSHSRSIPFQGFSTAKHCLHTELQGTPAAGLGPLGSTHCSKPPLHPTGNTPRFSHQQDFGPWRAVEVGLTYQPNSKCLRDSFGTKKQIKTLPGVLCCRCLKETETSVESHNNRMDLGDPIPAPSGNEGPSPTSHIPVVPKKTPKNLLFLPVSQWLSPSQVKQIKKSSTIFFKLAWVASDFAAHY